MAFDYKKEYKDLYQPKRMPVIVTVPAMRFVAVDGVGAVSYTHLTLPTIYSV